MNMNLKGQFKDYVIFVVRLTEKVDPVAGVLDRTKHVKPRSQYQKD